MPRRSAKTWESVDRGKHRRAIELRKHHIPEAELVVWREGNMRRRGKRVTSRSGGVKEPGMCGHSPHGNRETSGRSLRGSEAAMAEATGKVCSRNPGVYSPEESDGNMVPEKLANKGTATPAESMEGKTPAERNSGQEAACRAQNRESASIGLARVRQRAEADKQARFNNLFHFLKVDLLRASFYELKRNAAPGMDGVTWQAYEQTLEERLPELEHELHIGSYRATPARREYITKDDGRQRPLGIMTIEDKVVQQACVTILNEVILGSGLDNRHLLG
jgi:RNA-directed DNA polymerase